MCTKQKMKKVVIKFHYKLASTSPLSTTAFGVQVDHDFDYSQLLSVLVYGDLERKIKIFTNKKARGPGILSLQRIGIGLERQLVPVDFLPNNGIINSPGLEFYKHNLKFFCRNSFLF